MENSSCMGLVAVFAISSSVVLVSLQVQKRLVSEFMKKVESELGMQSTSFPSFSFGWLLASSLNHFLYLHYFLFSSSIPLVIGSSFGFFNPSLNNSFYS